MSRFAYPKWWGAKRDGATDGSSAVNAAIASRAGEIRFAAGTYRFNATIKHNVVQIRGVGSATNDEGGTVKDPVTVLESYSDTGWIFTIDVPDAPSGIMWGWQLREIRDIYFRGKSGTTRTSNCIRFGSTFVTNADALGRWEIKNCQLRNFDKVIYKPFGQIGNMVRGCYFAHANYHVFIERVGTSNWHGGCDTFEKCAFLWAYKASQYIDSTQSGSGQIVYRDCDFEANPGFGILVYNYNTDWQPGLILENVWVEANHTDATVNINGVDYPTKDMYLRNCKNFMMVNTPISNMQLVNSNIFAYNPTSQEQQSAGIPAGYESIDKDADSSFIVQGANITTSTTNPGYYASSINSIKSTKPYGAALNTKPWNKISTNTDSLRSGVSFANANTYQWDVAVGGGGPYSGNSVADGRIFDSAWEIEVPSGKTIYPNSGSGTIQTTGKYVVWTVDFKQVSGEQIKFYVNNITYLAAGAHVSIPSRWTTFAGMAKSDGTSYSAGIDLVAPGTGNGTVRISALQIHGFATYEESVKFLDSGVYCVGTKRPRII